MIRRRLTPKPTPELPTQKLHDVSVSDTAIGESTTVLPMLSTDSADNKNLSKTMQANTTANPAPFASTPSTLSALTVLTTTKFPVGLRNLTASENQDLTTQNTRITTASQVASFPPISDSLPVKKDTDLPATVNVTSSNSVNSTVKKGPKIRPTLPPLPIVPLIFRNFRALNNSSVNTVP